MKKITITLTFILFSFLINAQVGIGTTTPQGALDIVSTNDTGVVIPRVSSIDNVTDGQGNPPANGTLVYDLSKSAICFYLNGNWTCMEIKGDGSTTLESQITYYESQDTYFKASNTGTSDKFGSVIVLSADGNTLVVGASGEDSNATDINGDQTDNSAVNSGAVYVFFKNAGVWSQQAYIKASNTGSGDVFGWSIGISGDGNTLAVGANGEDSNATGINGDQTNNSASASGAVYVFNRSGADWSQQAYIKASNSEFYDNFGYSIGISGDGNTLAVGANYESSNATGVGGDQSNNSAYYSGAVYVFSRSGATWSQQAYIKASNSDTDDYFGTSVSISFNGNTLAVGASEEDSNAIGIDGNQANNSSSASGAVYVFSRSGAAWSQQAYIKASNTDTYDYFGGSVSISADGNTLVVGANGEDSNATDINGDQSDNNAFNSGAVYVFIRSGTNWSQQVYIKAFNTDPFDYFGGSVSISADGNTLVVGANGEDSNATGVDGDQADNSVSSSGSVYIYSLSGLTWSPKAYIKASNTDTNDVFGRSTSLSNDGNILVVGARGEKSNATGVGGDQTNNSATSSGAVYMYEN
ncbi:hypothetical protein [Winogradskyella sp. Asnod2-B02-A]|uniref:hypothetical protein n=1 Tax=Winogradskyella sp. Asnod2-B02-A TaxID=3160583 RepID=UPI003863CA8E